MVPGQVQTGRLPRPGDGRMDAPGYPVITMNDQTDIAMVHLVHSEQKSVSTTRSTKATKRNVILFEKLSLTWEPPYGIEP